MSAGKGIIKRAISKEAAMKLPPWLSKMEKTSFTLIAICLVQRASLQTGTFWVAPLKLPPPNDETPTLEWPKSKVLFRNYSPLAFLYVCVCVWGGRQWEHALLHCLHCSQSPTTIISICLPGYHKEKSSPVIVSRVKMEMWISLHVQHLLLQANPDYGVGRSRPQKSGDKGSHCLPLLFVNAGSLLNRA